MSIVTEIIQNPTINNNQKYYRIMKIQNRYLDTAEYKQEKRLHEKLTLSEQISNECRLNSFEKQEVQDIIIKIPNFKDICKNCKQETIICFLVLRTKKRYGDNIKIDRYSTWNKYKMNWKVYGTLADNLTNYFYKHTYIK